MAELNTKENETKEVVKETSATPFVLSEDQVNYFTDLIKDNSPYLQDEISRVKTDFPETFGDISAFSDTEIANFTDTFSDEFQERLSNYQSIALPDVTSISSTTGFTVMAADPNSARFAERTDTALKNYFKIASEVDNFNLDLSGELSKLTKMVGNFSKTFIGKISDSLSQGLVGFIDSV